MSRLLDETPANLQQFVCEFFTQPDLARRGAVHVRRRSRARAPPVKSKLTRFPRAQEAQVEDFLLQKL